MVVPAWVISYCGVFGCDGESGGGGVPLLACSCNHFCTISRNFGGNVEPSPVMWEIVDGSSKSPRAITSDINLVITSNWLYGWSIWSGWLGSGSLSWS